MLVLKKWRVIQDILHLKLVKSQQDDKVLVMKYEKSLLPLCNVGVMVFPIILLTLYNVRIMVITNTL